MVPGCPLLGAPSTGQAHPNWMVIIRRPGPGRACLYHPQDPPPARQVPGRSCAPAAGPPASARDIREGGGAFLHSPAETAGDLGPSQMFGVPGAQPRVVTAVPGVELHHHGWIAHILQDHLLQVRRHGVTVRRAGPRLRQGRLVQPTEVSVALLAPADGDGCDVAGA